MRRERKKIERVVGDRMDGGRLYLINKVAAKECTLLGRVDSSPLSVISTTRAATSSQPGGRLSTSAVELGNDYRKRGGQRRRVTGVLQIVIERPASRYNIARGITDKLSVRNR